MAMQSDRNLVVYDAARKGHIGEPYAPQSRRDPTTQDHCIVVFRSANQAALWASGDPKGRT